MRLSDKFSVIVNCAVRGWILHKCAKNGVVEFEAREVVDLDLDAERLRAGTHDLNGLRVAIVCDQKSFSRSSDSVAERHRFGGGGCFVEERCVADIELGKIDNHCLKIEQRFETALSEFGLVRRVSGVPTGVFQDISLYDWRRGAIVITGADERACDFVLFRDRAQFGHRFALRFCFR